MKFTSYDLELSRACDDEINIPNTLAEYFFQKSEFYIGKATEDTIETDLSSVPGKRLQFASGSRYYFSEGMLREQLYPNKSDAVAYGSLVFTPCKSFHEFSNLKILIIDHETGECGSWFDREFAKNLVGDCWGRISPSLAREITGTDNTPFQFRLGIKIQRGSAVNRIGKGTLAPFFELWQAEGSSGKHEGLSQVHLLLPTSSFKGRKGNDAITPGMHQLSIGLGRKQDAFYGTQSLGTQVLVNYPEAVRQEILPVVEEKAFLLSEAQKHPTILAEEFVSSQKSTEALNDPYFENHLETSEALDPDEPQGILTRSTIQLRTELIEKDVKHFGQLLEHRYISDTLKSFVRRTWLDLATGRSVKFMAGMAQPCRSLAKDEVCIPFLPDGERVIVTRSPLINSNGVIILTNRHREEFARLTGIIALHPESAAAHLQADFDGDRLAFERASKYPVLAREIEQSLLPENRYPDVIKMAKIPYRGSLEEIALSASDLDIGSFANGIVTYVALRTQIPYLDSQQKRNWASAIRAMAQLLQRADERQLPRIVDEGERELFTIQRTLLLKIANLPRDETEHILNLYDRVLFYNVALVQNHLQIAADGPKSALRPSKEILNYCNRLASIQSVPWITQKKHKEIYLNQPLQATGESSIDKLIATVNRYWQENPIVTRPSEAFRFLFPVPEPVDAQKVLPYREALRNLSSELAQKYQLSQQYPEVERAYATLTSTKSGRTLLLTQINPNVFDSLPSNANMTVGFRRDRERPNYLWAVNLADEIDESQRVLGRVAKKDIKDNKLHGGTIISEAKVARHQPITKMTFASLYESLDAVARKIDCECPTAQSRQRTIAALWHNTFAPHKQHDHRYTKGSELFTLFHSEILQQLESDRLNEFTLVGTCLSDYPNATWRKKVITIKVKNLADVGRVAVYNDKTIGKFSSQNPAPLPGTQLEVSIDSQQPASVVATTPKGNEIVIRQVRKYSPGHTWSDEKASIQIAREKTRTGKPRFIAKVGDRIIGVVDPDSLEQMSDAGVRFEGNKSVTLSVTLQSSPPNTAIIEVLRDTRYSSREVDELSISQKQDYYRAKYLRLVSRLLETKPDLQDSEIDTHLGLMLFQNKNRAEWRSVRSVLSQSDTVRGWKRTISDENVYKQKARDYICSLQNRVLHFQNNAVTR